MKLGASSSHPIPSMEKPLILEEKPLLALLRYAYLGDSSALMIIISFSLSTSEEEKFLRVLRAHKVAIGWFLADIKGI